MRGEGFEPANSYKNGSWVHRRWPLGYPRAKCAYRNWCSLILMLWMWMPVTDMTARPGCFTHGPSDTVSDTVWYRIHVVLKTSQFVILVAHRFCNAPYAFHIQSDVSTQLRDIEGYYGILKGIDGYWKELRDIGRNREKPRDIRRNWNKSREVKSRTRSSHIVNNMMKYECGPWPTKGLC